ncbi:hypothetical protein FRC01_003808 [Tulasnella sp. 417]|nr:hypothetical protein FRC01_003808 [Tulasnella sp. 417]
MKHFVETAQLPWKKTKVASDPDASPWVHLGCSYPGVLSAYTQQKYPNLFAAAWATSAPVQAQGDFWQYYEPIEEGMPKNCSKDVALAIKSIDKTLREGSDDQKYELKKSFGLEALENGDFGRILSRPFNDWQNMEATYSNYHPNESQPFFQFCDAIETHDGKTSADGGALNRQWYWMICTEFGWWMDGDPGNYSSIVSDFVTEEWNLRQCNYMFPNEDGAPGDFHPNKFGTNAEHGGQNPQAGNFFVVNGQETPGNVHLDVSGTNLKHGGWNLQANNLFVVNGEFDPWRSASLSSNWAPQHPDTPHQKVEVIKEGHHCWDTDLGGAEFNRDIQRVVDLGITTVKGWLEEWYRDHPNVRNSMASAVGEYWKGILPT